MTKSCSPLFNATVLAIYMADCAKAGALINICEASSGMHLCGKQPPEEAYTYILSETVPLLVYAYRPNSASGGFRSFGVLFVNPRGDFSEADDFNITVNGPTNNPLVSAEETVHTLLTIAEDNEVTSLDAVAQGFNRAREWVWNAATHQLFWSA